MLIWPHTAAMGGAYEFTKCASANLREKNDVYNTTLGGFVAGSILGLRCTSSPAFSSLHIANGTHPLVRSLPAVIGYGAALAALLGGFDLTGGSLRGMERDPNVDEVSRKEYIRKNRRRPVEETVHQLGEGRGEFR